MRKLLAILPALLLTGCGDYGYIHTKTVFTDTEKAAEFIVKCAEAANPLSDEEGEDLVAECKFTAKELYGEKMFVAKHVSRGGSLGSEVCSGKDYPSAMKCFKEIYPTLKID